MKKIHIDIISDFICPWCYIGKFRLERAISRTEANIEVKTTLRPFQLYPHIPQGGLPKSSFKGARKPGLGQALRKAAEAEKLILNYKKIDRIPNTLEAHRLMELCENESQKNQLGLALFQCYFEEGRDLEDKSILSELGIQSGLTRQSIHQFLHSRDGEKEVSEEIDHLKAEGISAVPSFKVNNEHLITGIHPIKNWLRFFNRLST